MFLRARYGLSLIGTYRAMLHLDLKLTINRVARHLARWRDPVAAATVCIDAKMLVGSNPGHQSQSMVPSLPRSVRLCRSPIRP